MSTLQEDVARGLGAQGLRVEEDRGGLVVRDPGGQHVVSVWVDETERVVRAEEVLCYPVDDFSEELCVAMDQLNEARVGLTISYQEQQRALVAATVWTSPSRSPSSNQLHLLVALLHEARERDADALTRIADGEATWFDVADELVGASRAPRVRPARDGFVSSEPPTRAFGAPAWGEPPTRPLDQVDGALEPRAIQRGATARLDAGDFQPRRTEGVGARRARARDDEPERPSRAHSRIAFQMAVSAAEPKGPPKVDLAAEHLGLGHRLMRCFGYLLVFAFVLGLGLHFGHTFRPDIFSLEVWLPRETHDASSLEAEYRRRSAMQPGRTLLALELSDPRDFASLGVRPDFVRRSLEALGDRRREVLEDLIVRGASEEARKRAYRLWREQGFHTAPGARLGLLRKLAAANIPEDAVVVYLANDLQESPPTFGEAIEALSWAPGPAWRALIEFLGTPGEGADERAKALAAQLPRDTEDAVVLRALIATGHAPADALAQLVDKRGLEWARKDGHELLVSLVRKDPQQASALLAAKDDVERQVLAVELLAAAETEEANALLLRALKDRRLPTRVRLAAMSGVRKNALTEATWALVLVVCGSKEEKALRDAARRVLEKIPAAEAVEQLEPYLAAERKYAVRHYAVLGLAALQAPSAVQKLLEVFSRDPDLKIRRLAGKKLTEALEDEEARVILSRALPQLREMARKEQDGVVRREASELYRSLTGR